MMFEDDDVTLLLRCRMAKKLRDLGIAWDDFAVWICALRIRGLTQEQLEFVTEERVWDFLVTCWAKFKQGITFSFLAAQGITDSPLR